MCVCVTCSLFRRTSLAFVLFWLLPTGAFDIKDVLKPTYADGRSDKRTEDRAVEGQTDTWAERQTGETDR